jgi:uncharacterized membrane protein
MAKKDPTGNIIVLGFPTIDGAENMLANVESWEKRGFFTVKDAVVVTKGSGANQLEIKQTVKKAGKWALGGGGIGFLAGMLVGGPIGGIIVGATVGAISGALKDSGIDDKFIRSVSNSMSGDTSTLFVMVTPNPDRDEAELMKELAEQRATVISTTLAPDREEQLRNKLSGKG